MKRAMILLLDSVGIGAAPDADKFGDVGANTLGHIAEECAAGHADSKLRHGKLSLPNLTNLGLNKAATKSSGRSIIGLNKNVNLAGAYGYCAEISHGKDTPSGHWEITGVPVLFDWGYFQSDYPSFPEELVEKFIKEAGVPGILGNKAASGTTIIAEHGDESVKTGKPIVYTSADSVFQIAAHEEAFGLERLYEVCKIARKLIDPYNIGRVIARPFIGSSGNYQRTGNRHDYSVPPPAPTLLDKLSESNGTVIGIGKIPDIFAHRGLSKEVPAVGNQELFDKTLEEIKTAPDRSLIFTNFVDFDMLYGHRRDVSGYANALEVFDSRLPELKALLQPGDVVIVTADHGCDPTFKGTDHTREYVPLLVFGPGIEPECLGKRETFADIGQSLAKYFDLEPFEYGKSFL